MGAFKVSCLLKFLCMISFTGMLVVNSVFIIELLFGKKGWSVDLPECMRDEFTFLILLALASLFFTLSLFFTPLRSSVNEPHMRTCTRELQKEKTKQSESREENDSVEVSDNIYQDSIAKTIHKGTLDCQRYCSFIESESFVGDPGTNVNSGEGSHKSGLVPNPATACTSYGMKSLVDEVCSGGSDILNPLQQSGFLESNEGNMMLKRGVTTEGDQPSSSSELLESSCNSDSNVYGSKESIMTDKSASVVIGKEAASGMSRGGKRQLAAILDEFWGLLFDYHGKLTKEAKSLRAAILLGLYYEPLPTSTELETARKTSSPKGQEAETDPPLPIISSSYNSSPIMLTVPSSQSSNAPVSPPSWSPVVQYRDRQPNQHGAEAPSKISNSLEAQYLDSKTEVVPAAFTDDSKSKHYEDISKRIHFILRYETFWTKNHFVPSVNFIGEDKSIYNPHGTLTWGGKVIHSISGAPKKFLTYGESERLVLQSLRFCIRKLLRLDKSGWLFSQNGGPDEELIDYLAMTERLLHEDGSTEAHDDLIIFVPNISYCSKGCVWQASLVVSFAVWCVRRILELLLVESRPEIWGKYTYVLNRLQGILDPAFCKPRKSLSPCKCLQACHYSMENSVALQPTCRRSVLELIKEAEASTLRRKGRPGTGAGDIAFPKGKDNVTSVFRRYRHRLAK